MMKFFQYLFTCILACAPLFVSAQWIGPSSTPPNGNVPPPLNAGASSQIKLGPLEVVAGFTTQGDIVIQNAFTVGNWPGQATDNWLHVTNGNVTSPQYKDVAFGQAWIAGLLQNVGGISTQGALTVQQNSEFQGPAVFSQTALFQGAMTADALATFNQAAVFEQQATFKANAEVQGNLTVDGDITSRGQLTCLADGSNCPSSTVPNLQGVTAQGNTTTHDIQAPRLVDSDNVTYYVDPAGVTSGAFAGLLGIGVVTPQSPLEVNASLKNPQVFSPLLVRELPGGQDNLVLSTQVAGAGGGWAIHADGVDQTVFKIENGLNVTHFQVDTVSGNTALAPNGGNVGVGTLNPTERLHVSGGNLVVQSDSTPRLTIDNISGLPAMFHHQVNGGQYSIKADGAATGFITASNAHAPCGLDFQGTGARFFGANCDLQVDNGLRVANSVATNAGTLRWTGTDFEGYNGTTWQSFTGQGTSQLWQLQGNNIINTNVGGVGINGLQPAGDTRLAVDGDITFLRSDVTNQPQIVLQGDASGNYSIQSLGNTENHLLLQPNQGRVGIGTSNPTGTLNIQSTAQEALRLTGTPAANDAGFLHMRVDGGNDNYLTFTENGVADRGFIGFSAGNGNLNLGTGGGLISGGTTRVAISPQGNVGINTATPRGALDVGGGGRIYFAGGMTPTGGPVNQGFEVSDGAVLVPTYTGTEFSDLRLYLTDNAEDKFSIWGDTCNGGDCGSLDAASQAHAFDAGGTAYHRGRAYADRGFDLRNNYVFAERVNEESHGADNLNKEMTGWTGALTVEPGDRVLLDGGVLTRMTGGYAWDEFQYWVEWAGTGGCANGTWHIFRHVPATDGGGHTRWEYAVYKSTLPVSCSGTLQFRLWMRNHGDDGWMVHNRTITATRY